MDQTDLALLREAQNGIQITKRPYLALGEKMGISEEEVIRRLEAMREEGAVRRFAATIGHRALGILANAMIVWVVPPEDVERIGSIFAAADEVTHCYERATAADWPYNLYTMVHSKSREECIKTADRLSQAAGIKEFRVLFSEKEYKKTSAKI